MEVVDTVTVTVGGMEIEVNVVDSVEVKEIVTGGI